MWPHLHRREIEFEQLAAAHDGDQAGGRYQHLPGPLSSEGAPNRMSERSDDADRRQRQYQPRRCGDTPRIVRWRGVGSGMGEPPMNQVCADDGQKKDGCPVTYRSDQCREQHVLKLGIRLQFLARAVLVRLPF
jgi:hypothetical protein